MSDDLMWRKITERGIEVGLTDKAFELFGQLWSIIPTNDRKRNYVTGETVIAVEGSESLGTLAMPFTVKRITFNGDALERPDELTSDTQIFYAEAA